MLKKSTVAVITALATMLSALSPVTAYAETPETIKTIPERTVSAETLTPYATAPVIGDSEYVQTTAVTIPERDVYCTTVSAPPESQGLFPISGSQEVTIKLMDYSINEPVKGALVHVVETENHESNVIKRDFGTWNTSDSDSYTVNFDYTLENATDMALITAVVEYMPEEYTFWANTESPVFDYVVDASYMKFNHYNPNTEMTIGLRKKQSSETDTQNPDNTTTTSYYQTTTFPTTATTTVPCDCGGILQTSIPEYNDMYKCETCGKYIYESDGVTTPLGLFVCKECRAMGMGGTTTSTTVQTSDGLYPTLTTAATRECDCCGKYINESDGVTTSLGLFICQECKAMGAGGTTTSTTTTVQSSDIIYPPLTTAATRECYGCGKYINESDGVITPLGIFVCKKCRGMGMGGTTAPTPTHEFFKDVTTTTRKDTTLLIVGYGTFTVECAAYDSDTNEIIPNVEMAFVEDCNTEIIETWTSDSEPHLIENHYSLVGAYEPSTEHYRLIAYNLPDGYVIDETNPETMKELDVTKDSPASGNIEFKIYLKEAISYPENNENLIYGDANCDNKVNIADAVIIMQSLSNSDNYKLSEQGVINADVYNRGDGITSADALAIQEAEAKIISLSDLPLSK